MKVQKKPEGLQVRFLKMQLRLHFFGYEEMKMQMIVYGQDVILL